MYKSREMGLESRDSDNYCDKIGRANLYSENDNISKDDAVMST